MKKQLFVALLFLSTVIGGCVLEEKKASNIEESETNVPEFDANYAEELGADEYGMRQYIMAVLKEGPNRTQDSTETNRIQREHLDNINRMAEEGKLVLAGPFIGDQTSKGIYIFAVQNIEEAKKLTDTDPAIQSGRLVMELRVWYGSAALMEVNQIHKKIAKISI